MMTVEQERKANIKTGIVVMTTLGAGMGFLALMDSIERPEGITNYNNHLVGDGQCLDGTLYDANNGASVRSVEVDSSEMVTVEPAGSAEKLPVLHLLASEQTYDGITTYFIPQDHVTAAILSDNGCALQIGS